MPNLCATLLITGALAVYAFILYNAQRNGKLYRPVTLLAKRQGDECSIPVMALPGAV